MNSTERTSHPSRKQVEMLIEFLEKYPNLAKGFSKIPSVRDKSRKAWEGLSVKLNSLGGSVKTLKQWTKYWTDKKSAVKKKVSLRNKARNKTSSGFESVVELSEVEERIVALMGGESFSIGERHLEINPFPEPTSSSPSLLCDHNASLKEQQCESSTESLNDVDVFTPRAEVIPSSPELQTPPRAIPPNPLQSPTPSGSGKYPGRRRLDLGGVEEHTTSSGRQRLRNLRRSPPSQPQDLFVNIADRLLTLEEKRFELERCNSAILKDIAEGLKLLIQTLNKINS